MKKHQRSRNQLKVDIIGKYDRMQEEKPEKKASEAFHRKPYSTVKKDKKE